MSKKESPIIISWNIQTSSNLIYNNSNFFVPWWWYLSNIYNSKYFYIKKNWTLNIKINVNISWTILYGDWVYKIWLEVYKNWVYIWQTNEMNTNIRSWSLTQTISVWINDIIKISHKCYVAPWTSPNWYYWSISSTTWLYIDRVDNNAVDLIIL